MSPTYQAAVIPLNSAAVRSVKRTAFVPASLASFSFVQADEPTKPAMLLVTVLHVAAMLWLISTPQEMSQQPVLSFTVTLMDLSSSPHTISSAASAQSAPAAKPETKTVPENAKTGKTAPKKVAKVVAANPKANAKLSHSSVQQTAVLAPLTPAKFDAAYLNNPAPSYPPLSRRLGEQGKVLLAVYVNEAGRADNIQVRKSSGFDRLDRAARDAVQRWRFIAAHQGERLAASWVQVPISFILE